MNARVCLDRRRLLVAAAGLGAALPAAGAAEPEQRRDWPAGKPTPALALAGWDGGAPFRLAEARGQVVVLNFWASWCEPCRAELPSLELLAQRLESERVQVLAANFRETDGTIRRFLAQQPMTLPIQRDPDGAAARAFQVRIFPTTVVFGRDGRAAFTVTGELDWTGPQARRWLAPLL